MVASAPEANEAEAGLPPSYWQACRLAKEGQYDDARRLYAELEGAGAAAESDARVRALVQNDLAVLAAMEGRFEEARQGWQQLLPHQSAVAALYCAMSRQSWADRCCLKLRPAHSGWIKPGQPWKRSPM